MAREPTSLISDSMPASGAPLEDGMEEVIIEDDAEDTGYGELLTQEDGSVLFGDIEDLVRQELESAFDTNLAEVLDERDLMDISSVLLGYYEDDKSSRQEWEDAYTEGLTLLGLKYEEREQPFRGASV